ncbi:MAG TPA: hypothetical protein VGQ83_33785 [Polyangia bacterium]|jgi:hypothetical protein
MRHARSAAVALALSLVALAAGCGGGECRDGTVAVALVTLGGGTADPELPSDFGFTVAEMRAALTGTWTEPQSGRQLTVAVPADGVVSYSIAAEGTLCVTDVTMPVTADLGGTATAAHLTGTFMTGNLAGGELSMNGQAECDLTYAAPSGGAAATLQGVCHGVDGIVEMTFRKQ